MKKVILTNLILVLGLLMGFSLSAQVYSSCDQWATYSTGGYNIYNDVWGSGAGSQCLYINNYNSWWVIANHPNTSGIKSYPNVEKPVDIYVNDMGTVTSSFNVSVPSGGSYEATYDIWYDNYSYEIMLWMYYTGAVGPIANSYSCNGACPAYTNVSIGGHTWNVYQGNNGSNAVYSFLRTSNTTSGTVDIAAISQWIQSHGWFGNAHLHSIQFGFEITSSNGSQQYTLNNFSALASTGSSGGGSSSSYIQIQNRYSGLYVDGMGRSSNGSNCGQWSNSSSYNQQWTVETTGGYVKLKNRATGLYLDGMGRTSNGSAAGQWSSSSSYNQQWQEVSAGSYIRFKNRATGLYLDGMGRTSNGSDIGQWSSSSSYNQQFSIITVKDAETPVQMAENPVDVTVYPNPVSDGTLNIGLKGLSGNSTIRLLDTNGKLIRETRSTDQVQVQMKLNISSGVYIMQVINGETNVVKKVVVQ